LKKASVGAIGAKQAVKVGEKGLGYKNQWAVSRQYPPKLPASFF